MNHYCDQTRVSWVLNHTYTSVFVNLSNCIIHGGVHHVRYLFYFVSFSCLYPGYTYDKTSLVYQSLPGRLLHSKLGLQTSFPPSPGTQTDNPTPCPSRLWHSQRRPSPHIDPELQSPPRVYQQPCWNHGTITVKGEVLMGTVNSLQVNTNDDRMVNRVTRAEKGKPIPELLVS